MLSTHRPRLLKPAQPIDETGDPMTTYTDDGLTTYTGRRWTKLYGEGRPADIVADYPTMLDLFQASLTRAPDSVAIKYFDGVLTMADLDTRSDALALALSDHGFTAGDRLGVYVQNNPAFVVALLGAWKAGGVAVLVNPMNKRRELLAVLTDSGASALICLDDLYESVASELIGTGETDVTTVVTCSALDEQSRNDERLFADAHRTRPQGTLDLEEIYRDYAGRKPALPHPDPDDVAVLCYTSGTTGAPKGAMCTHGAMSFNSQTYRDWIDFTAADSVLGVAPLFHITGLIGHMGAALIAACPLVITHRFEPHVIIDAIREHRPTFTIGSITVFINLSAQDGIVKEDWASFRAIYSGGAAIPPAVIDRFLAKTGIYIHNLYGLTETNSPSHAVPLGSHAPVDPASGSLSVGVPIFNTVVRILDEAHQEVAVGENGELAISGPEVVPGYWKRPEATAEGIPGGELLTGDIGFMDADGWFYIVDRKKDMINASGFKVWPHQVEDVIYSHPAVHEVAVVGVPDEYRGESVKAYVSRKPGESLTEEELIAFCKGQMAAYKYPHSVEFLDDLPKTTSGKILRRELRDLNWKS
jgi:long-chain acyl-CoA synthetase